MCHCYEKVEILFLEGLGGSFLRVDLEVGHLDAPFLALALGYPPF